MTNRPVLIGMNSPQTADPDKALYPWDMKATGGRILSMIREAATRAVHERNRDVPDPVSVEDYLRVFDRRNLVNGTEWDPLLARNNATQMKTQLRQRDVVLCGLSVLEAFGFHRSEWLVWNKRDDHFFGDEFRYVLIPHPSGLTRDYNDPEKRAAVGDLLFDMYVGYLRVVSA